MFNFELVFSLLTFRYFSRNVPVKLAYASYESVNGAMEDAKQPIVIMHGLFGSKNNWNSLSKAIHQKTKRKVVTSIIYQVINIDKLIFFHKNINLHPPTYIYNYKSNFMFSLRRK